MADAHSAGPSADAVTIDRGSSVGVSCPMPRDPDDCPDSYPDVRLDHSPGFRPEDYASLYVRHRHTLELAASRLLDDKRDVDEVVHDAFLRMFLALPELGHELQALAYLRRTVINLSIDRIRAMARRPRLIDLDGVREGQLPASVDIDRITEAEDAVVVREALARLSPIHRAALVMREIEELPLATIALVLGVDDVGVKHLLFRARRALRMILVGPGAQPNQHLAIDDVLRHAHRRLAATSSAQRVGATLGVIALLIGAPWLARIGHPTHVATEALGGTTVSGSPLGSLFTAPRQQHPQPIPPTVLAGSAPQPIVVGANGGAFSQALPATSTVPVTKAGPSTTVITPPSHLTRPPVTPPAVLPSPGPPVPVPQRATPTVSLMVDQRSVSNLKVGGMARYEDAGNYLVTMQLLGGDLRTPSLSQSVQITPQGDPIGARVSLALPTSDGGQIGYLLDTAAGTSVVHAWQQPDHTWLVDIAGSATAQSVRADSAPRISVHTSTVYSPDLARVVSQQAWLTSDWSGPIA